LLGKLGKQGDLKATKHEVPAMSDPAALHFDMTLEIAIVPVADVERAKRFYADLGWRLDIDYAAPDGFRVIQFTPPGSGCSIMIGSNMTPAAPGSMRGLHLVVADLAAARAELIRRGVDVSEPFHDAGGIFHRADGSNSVAGLNPDRKSYASYVKFSDPDGNEWLIQEITARLGGPVEENDPRFTPQIVNFIRHGAP
jgi:catechol 2,3-dioxygenase-like lactoylglutathione lyase family enzyme